MSEPKRSALWAVVEQHMPTGWNLEEEVLTGDVVAYCTTAGKRIVCPPIISRSTLFLFLHEAGHIRMSHWGAGIERPREEYEAEQYAIKAMRAAGLAVPRKEIVGAKRYVRQCIEKVDPKWHLELDEEILRFAFGREWRKHR